MIRVCFVTHPIAIKSQEVYLETQLNSIDRNGGTILHITSDTEGYTIVYREDLKHYTVKSF